jgi:hypothetical protein
MRDGYGFILSEPRRTILQMPRANQSSVDKAVATIVASEAISSLKCQ